MLRAALRNLVSHKLRLSLTLLTIALGIAFVTGTNIFTDSLRTSFDSLFDQKQPDVSVTPKSAVGGNTGAQQLTLPQSDVARIRAIPGVAAAYGVVSVPGGAVIGKDGEVVGPPGPSARARSWLDDPALSPLTLSSGRAPQGPGEVVLLADTATQAGVSVGQQVGIDTPDGEIRPTVVGLATRGISGSLGGTLSVFDLVTAQRLFAEPGRVTGIAVRAAPGVSQDAVAARITAALGSSVQTRTGQQANDEIASRIEEGFSFFNTFLLVFGLIALFVSCFLIFNTFSMLIAARTRELAMLRAVGATRMQVAGSVLVEAAVLGLVAAGLGLLGGVGVSFLLTTLFERFGAPLPSTSLVVEPSTVLLAGGVGVAVTVLSALLPARRASVIPPVAAMREDASLPTKSLATMTAVGMGLVLLAVPAAWNGIRIAQDNTERGAAWVGVSALLALVGVIAMTPVLSRGLLRVLGLPIRRLAVGRLAVENSRRNPRRTAATASALAVGLALMTAIGVLASSAKTSVTQVIDTTVGADFVLFGKEFQPMSPKVFQAVEGAPGTAVVTYVRNVPIEVDGQRAALTGIDPAALPQVLDVTLLSGSFDDLVLGSALVDSKTAKDLGIRVGQTVPATFVNGKGELRIVGTFEPAGLLQGFVTTLPTISSIGSLERDSVIYVRVAEGADPVAVRKDLQARIAAFPTVQVQDQADIKRQINGQFDALFGFVYALLALSIVVAFLGIVNTLSLSVFERTRELGLLRAVGTARAQVRRMVVLEAVLIAVFGALVGVALGLVFGALVQKVLEPQGITTLSVPGGQIVAFVLLGALGGVVAALWPAFRASRLNVLRAIATE